MYNARSKIVKKDEPTEVEMTVARTIYELEMNQSELKSELREVLIMSVIEFATVINTVERKALIINILFRSLAPLRKVHARVVEELEK